MNLTLDTLPPLMPGSVCAETDPDLFFPAKGKRSEATAAKKLCHICPNAQQCLGWALKTRQSYGVYGGMTAHERLVFLRSRGKA